MKEKQQLEFWLRGPVSNIISALQPGAHAILQAKLEVTEALKDFPENLLWQRPAGVASVAFHLQHLAGVLDRLFTYARGEQLSAQQLTALQNEGKEDADVSLVDLLQKFDRQADAAINQLKNTSEKSLFELRGVGRKQIPSTTLGLLFHAAEHVQRHTGQLLVTARIVKNKEAQ